MRRMLVGLCGSLFLTTLLLGCGRQAPVPQPAPVQGGTPVQPALAQGQPGQTVPSPGPTAPPQRAFDFPAILPPELTPEERYNAALLDALNLMAERKYIQAAAALEGARAIQDNEQVRRELEKVRLLIAQQAATEKTIEDIQTVLNEGRPEEASRLAAAALLQVGGSDDAAALGRLKRQADALLAAQGAEAAARKQQLQQEAQHALTEQNLRAAAIAFDQALQLGDDPTLRQTFTTLQTRLSTYDQRRQRAHELRQDPYQLEEAIEALQEAAKAWDTFQVRQELDECNLALQKRRDRLGVAEFEVRGDVGVPLAGRVVADELLPAFRTRFDLVERGQLNKVLGDLRLQAEDLAGQDEARRELARITRTRYLVLGSLTPLDGITIHARVVDLRTGLIVQTAKIVAPTPELLIAQVPQLAGLLMMTDEQRLDYDQQRARRAAPPRRVAFPDPLPPPPAAPALGGHLPPPILFDNTPPPDAGGLRFEDFDRLPVIGIDGPPPAPPTINVEAETRVKNGLLHVAVDLGDNLFRAGRFQEAFAQFDLALNLNPGNTNIRIRLDRCRPHLPPHPVIVTPPPPPPPRVAVLDFQVYGDPSVPPTLGPWVAEQLAPYFAPPYQLVDRAEVWWYMGRLGLTKRDLLTDPAARRWLGRALNVRYFVTGAIRAGQGLETTTYLLDAEDGYLAGRGRVLGYDKRELKLKLPELARLTLLPPRERERYLQDHQQFDQLVAQGRGCFEKNDFVLAIDFFTKARKLRPDSVQLTVLLNDCDARQRQAQLEANARREWERQRAAAEEWARRQRDLAAQAENARLLALREASDRADALRQQQLLQRDRACEQLLVQARAALQVKNFGLCIELFESASQLRRNDAVLQELALARGQFEESRRVQAAQAQAAREAELRRQRDAELAQVRAQVEAERRQREAQERVRREAEEARATAQYLKLRDEGQRQLDKNNYVQAIASFQSAKRIKKSDEILKLIDKAIAANDAAIAKEAGQKAELQKQLDAERAARELAEAAAKKNKELYEQTLQLAVAAMNAKRYDIAIARYQDAGKIYRTEEVQTGLRQAEDARRLASQDQQKKDAEAKRAADLARLQSDGQAALTAKKFDDAVKHFTAAKALDPANRETLTGLTRAEALRDAQAVDARRIREEQERQAAFQRLMDAGNTNMTAKQYEAAVSAYTEAQKLDPKNAGVKTALAAAVKARDGAVKDVAEAKKRQDQYQKLIQEGRLAAATNQHDAAIKAFEEALKLQPADQVSARLLDDAKKAKGDAAKLVQAETKKREEDTRRAAEVRKTVNDARFALAGRDFDKAGKLIAQARQSAPNDPDVLKLQSELDAAQKKPMVEAKPKPEDDKQKRLEQLVASARDAIKNRKLDDAKKALDDAAQLAPRDLEVLRAQRELAQAQLQAKPTPPPVPPANTKDADFKKALDSAATAERQLKYADAVQAYKDALKVMPNDPKATTNLRFAQRMADGQKALAAKKYKDAVKEFEDALKLIPDQADAKKLLKQAKDGK